jgi:dienelactone hydrolase
MSAPFFFAILGLVGFARGAEPTPLPGTQPLVAEGDLPMVMLDGFDRFLDRHTAASIEQRAALWKRDTSSPAKYEQSIAGNRAHLATILGVVDAREKFEAPELVATVDRPALVGKGDGYQVFAVRWPAIRGIYGEGLLLVPNSPKGVDVIALPDADQTPEMICGLVEGVPPKAQFARRMAETGCRVVVPVLVSRADTYSVAASGRATNQPHREWVYRPAFEMGRHVIGYEVQKVLGAVDWFERDAAGKPAKIGVFGYGEGGMLALYAGALDPRITSVGVSGYFSSQQEVAQEPIYRNVMGLLHEFGDAEIASLIAPRKLTIEACAGPPVSGPPAPAPKRGGAAPGVLITPSAGIVTAEVERAKQLIRGLGEKVRPELYVVGDGTGMFADEKTMFSFLYELGLKSGLAELGAGPTVLAKSFDVEGRQRRAVEQMQEFTQSLVRESPYVRNKFWANADRKSKSPEKWKQTTESYRQNFEDTVIGRFDDKMLPPNVRTRQIFDEPGYLGYEVLMDVWPDVTATGILLVPKGIKAGERRPVVVCQHGLEGRPRDVADPKIDSPYYHRFACKLADQGFITYAPQNAYIGMNRFRQLVRKADPLGATLWTFIIAQHRQSTDWLAGLPYVDPQRIAFYGLSYGGKSAMRIPAVVGRYCLSICSGDFNEWIWKCTSLRYSGGYPATQEYEMFEWNLGNTYNYFEMAGLIAPRPFMVERGHRDGVGIDEWVAYEYAKVKYLYDDLGIGDRTTIEYFDGPHMINGVGTFKFLHEQLKWPR